MGLLGQFVFLTVKFIVYLAIAVGGVFAGKALKKLMSGRAN